MVSSHYLSGDILELILDHLIPESQLSNLRRFEPLSPEITPILRSLRLVNHNFHHAASPRLFHTVGLLTPNEQSDPRQIPIRNLAQRCQQLVNIAESPHADSVHRVEITLPVRLSEIQRFLEMVESSLVTNLPKFHNLESFKFEWPAVSDVNVAASTALPAIVFGNIRRGIRLCISRSLKDVTQGRIVHLELGLPEYQDFNALRTPFIVDGNWNAAFKKHIEYVETLLLCPRGQLMQLMRPPGGRRPINYFLDTAIPNIQTLLLDQASAPLIGYNFAYPKDAQVWTSLTKLMIRAALLRVQPNTVPNLKHLHVYLYGFSQGDASGYMSRDGLPIHAETFPPLTPGLWKNLETLELSSVRPNYPGLQLTIEQSRDTLKVIHLSNVPFRQMDSWSEINDLLCTCPNLIEASNNGHERFPLSLLPSRLQPPMSITRRLVANAPDLGRHIERNRARLRKQRENGKP